MSDLISRADAIDAIREECWECNNMFNDDLYMKILALPSADRPSGEWQSSVDDFKICSVCGFDYCSDIAYKYFDVSRFDYCPSCGAFMKGGNE